MSACCSAYGNVADAHFDHKIAKRDLDKYRSKGPEPTARLLRDLLVGTGAVERTLLDVGSGVGGLSFELLERGVEHAIAVKHRPPTSPPRLRKRHATTGFEPSNSDTATSLMSRR